MKTRISVSVAGLTLIALLGVWYLFTGDTFLRQKRNMKRAGDHLPAVRAALDAVPEFRHLTVGVFTGAGGSLAVGGSLPSDSDVERVRQVVERTAPPVRVVYHIHIVATNEFRQTLLWAEPDAGPNDEERDQPSVPMRTSLARSSSSVSFAFDTCMIGALTIPTPSPVTIAVSGAWSPQPPWDWKGSVTAPEPIVAMTFLRVGDHVEWVRSEKTVHAEMEIRLLLGRYDSKGLDVQACFSVGENAVRWRTMLDLI